MIMSELKFQSQIIDDAKAFNKNTFGLKMNNRFISGVPDLMLKVPGYDVILIEAKLIRPTSKGVIHVNTTDIQRAMMRLMYRAGFRVEVWVAVGIEDKHYLVRTTYNVTSLNIGDCELIGRIRGSKWPIEYLLKNRVDTSHLDA